MKSPTNNTPEFLNQAQENGLIDISDPSITGQYEGDELWAAGEYEFLDLNAEQCRFNTPTTNSE
jgi:hypothetical protein